MRRSLRVAGDRSASAATPRTLLNELYANGGFSVEEFAQLEYLYQQRNRLAHEFAVESLDAGSALLAISLRLLAEGSRSLNRRELAAILNGLAPGEARERRTTTV
jgi:hypothetical protein